MSKLLDRLDSIARGTPRAMGFAATTRGEPVPQLALVAWITDPAKVDAAPLAEAGVDGYVLHESTMGKDGSPQRPDALKELPYGVMVEGADLEKVDGYRKQGADFLVFDTTDTPIDLLEEGDCARALRVTADMEEAQLRGLEDLPVDLVILRKPAPDGPLTLTHMLAISGIRAATSRYLLLEWSADLTSRELVHLRDAGVDGIVVNVTEAQPSVVPSLRETISALPQRKPRGEQRSVAMLPRDGGQVAAAPQRQEEEEDDEEWDEP